jgi:hypothetical protein
MHQQRGQLFAPSETHEGTGYRPFEDILVIAPEF